MKIIKSVKKEQGTILMAGTLFGMFAMIYLGVASAMTKHNRESTINKTNGIYLKTERLTKALERYYLSNCLIGTVDINTLVGNYIDARYVTSSFGDFNLSIENNSGVIQSNVSFTFAGEKERSLSQKTLMSGASVAGEVLTMSKIITDQRNPLGESVSLVSGNSSAAGCS
ncbi:MAG: hypothetical protein ACJA0H_001384 [Francisellaceae bacterium]|jgi:hypothetical protein